MIYSLHVYGRTTHHQPGPADRSTPISKLQVQRKPTTNTCPLSRAPLRQPRSAPCAPQWIPQGERKGSCGVQMVCSFVFSLRISLCSFFKLMQHWNPTAYTPLSFSCLRIQTSKGRRRNFLDGPVLQPMSLPVAAPSWAPASSPPIAAPLLSHVKSKSGQGSFGDADTQSNVTLVASKHCRSRGRFILTASTRFRSWRGPLLLSQTTA
jgi:hypothetical protein